MSKEHISPDYQGKYRQCLLAAGLILCSCLSLMAAPLVNYSKEEGSRVSGILLSLFTWALVLSAAVLVQRISAFASRRAARDRGYAGERYRRERIRLLTLAANPEGLAAELIFLVGVVLWVLRASRVIYLEGPMRMLQYSLSSSGFLLHCFFNGKNYIYIKRKAKKEKRGAQR